MKRLISKKSLHVDGFKVVLITICAISLLVNGNLYAQPYPATTSYFEQFSIDNVKNYSTEIVSSSTGSAFESVRAGTAIGVTPFYLSSTYNVTASGDCVHYLKLKDCNNTTAYASTAVSRLYSEPGMDMHAISVHERSMNEYYITTTVREQAPLVDFPYTGTSVHGDKIRVLKVDGSGNILGEITIAENSVMPSPTQWWGYSLYPTSSEIWGGDEMYICGYVAMSNTQTNLRVLGGGGGGIPFTPGTLPDFYTPKQGFIMSMNVSDPNPAKWKIDHCVYFDMPINTSGCGIGGGPSYLDYDIPLHMQQIFWGPLSSCIFVTGSISHQAAPGVSCDVRSATLSLLVDYNLNVVSQKSFIQQTAGNEYGIGMVESDNSMGNDCYIVSDRYTTGPNGYFQPANNWDNVNGGYNDKPDNSMFITHTDGYFNPSQNRLMVMAGWGSNVIDLPNYIKPSNFRSDPNATRLNIAGLTYSNSYSCNTSLSTSNTNIDPFMMELDLNYKPWPSLWNVVSSGSTAPGANRGMVVYPNLSGTGNAATDWNAYTRLGNGLTYNAWLPHIADLYAGLGSGPVISAPKWDISGWVSYPPAYPPSQLGLKEIYADVDYLDFRGANASTPHTCPVARCNVNTYSDGIMITNTPQATFTSGNVILQSSSTVNETYIWGTFSGDCQGGYNGGTQNYRIINVVSPKFITNKTIITPNPASHNINVLLQDGITDSTEVKIILQNLLGQNIQVLYEGKADYMYTHKTLQLPDVANGMYLLHISAGGTAVSNQKLSIQQ